jgi:Kef-type K+ transport system membrane component KefB
MNPGTIEGHYFSILIQWMVIITVAWVFGRLARRFGQPTAVGEILAGILLGPSALGLIWPAHWPVLFPDETRQSLQLLGKIGLIFLLFQVGMEVNFSHIYSRSRTILWVSILGMAAPFLCGLTIGPWLHDHFAPSTPFGGFQFFLCISLSISALPIMGRILLEMKLERTPIGAMSISAAAIDDVIGWVLLGLAITMATTNSAIWCLAPQLVGILAFYLLLQKFIGPWLCKYWRTRVSNSNKDQLPPSFLALLLIGLFTCALITHELGIFVIFGAFLFGVSLHLETSLVKAWHDRFSGLVFVAFVPVFFTNSGLNTNIGSLKTPEAWLACLLVFIAGTIGKLGGCYFGARVTGQPPQEAGCIAALMNTRGAMALISINIGLDLKLLTPALFTMLIIMALLTTAMCGPLLRWRLPKDHLI